jgi:hypothetical protein
VPYLRRDWAYPWHICAGTGISPATSAPGLGGTRAFEDGKSIERRFSELAEVESSELAPARAEIAALQDGLARAGCDMRACLCVGLLAWVRACVRTRAARACLGGD